MKHDFDQLTAPQLRDLASRATLVIPLGACEQHGQSLPVGTDAALITAIASRAAERAVGEDFVITPTISIGVSPHHVPFGGTLSCSTDTFGSLLRDVITSAGEGGWTACLLLNGHGGNSDIIRLVARRASSETGLVVAAADYWRAARTKIEAVVPDGWPVPGHGGAFEATLLRALVPEVPFGTPDGQSADKRSLLDLAFPDGYSVELPHLWARIDGFTDEPVPAEGGLVAQIGDAVVAGVSETLLDFAQRARTWRAGDVDRLRPERPERRELP